MYCVNKAGAEKSEETFMYECVECVAMCHRNLPKWEPSDPQHAQQVSKVSSPPNKSPYGVALLKDQKYGPGERHVLDVYVPERLKSEDTETALVRHAPAGVHVIITVPYTRSMQYASCMVLVTHYHSSPLGVSVCIRT